MSDFTQWVTHGIKRGRFEMSSRTALYLCTFIVILTLVAALYLTLVSRTAARGRHIEQLQTELFRLQRENAQLELENAKMGSIPQLWERAAELGFAPAKRVDFLYTSSEGR
jgi:cell division protein FtsB